MYLIRCHPVSVRRRKHGCPIGVLCSLIYMKFRTSTPEDYADVLLRVESMHVQVNNLLLRYRQLIGRREQLSTDVSYISCHFMEAIAVYSRLSFLIPYSRNTVRNTLNFICRERDMQHFVLKKMCVAYCTVFRIYFTLFPTSQLIFRTEMLQLSRVRR